MIGVDPGEVTGVAFYNVNGFTSVELPGGDAMSFISERALKRVPLGRLHIGCERWVNRSHVGRMSAQPRAQLLIGALTEFARTQAGVELELQSPGDAQRAVSHSVLKRLQWDRSTRDGHANDAAAQIGLLMLRHFPALWYQLINPIESDS
jgi:hypothetical protein